MAEPTREHFYIRQGTKFGPVIIRLGPMQTGAAVDLADAIIRLRSPSGSRDSTIANGEIVLDDEALTVTWTLLGSATSELGAGLWQGALILTDSDDEPREPLDLAITVTERL